MTKRQSKAQQPAETWFETPIPKPGLADAVKETLRYSYHKIAGLRRRFEYAGQAYPYFIHRYNSTYRNERIVEIPIVKRVLDWDRERRVLEPSQKGSEEDGTSRVRPGVGRRRVLEVGNVLSHYFPVRHDVLDKYEKSPDIINKDITAFKTAKKYDLIIGISTLEHVGWDERPRDPGKIARAVASMRSLLAPGGRIVLTLPLGYNPHLDRMLDRKQIRFSEARYLKRVSRDNRWIETEWAGVRGSRYNSPYPFANALVIGWLEKEPHRG